MDRRLRHTRETERERVIGDVDMGTVRILGDRSLAAAPAGSQPRLEPLGQRSDQTGELTGEQQHPDRNHQRP